MNRSKYTQRAIISSVEGDRLEDWRDERRAAGRMAAQNRRRSVWGRAAVVGLVIDVVALGVLALACWGLVAFLSLVF